MVRVSPLPQPQHGPSNLELGVPELYFSILPGDPPAALPSLYSTLYGDTLNVSALLERREGDGVPRIPKSLPPQHGPSYPELGLPELRLVALPGDPPSAPPPYSSLYKDSMTVGVLLKREDEIRQNAMHPVKLQAGASPPPNGAFGLKATPNWVPEVLSGAFYSCSI